MRVEQDWRRESEINPYAVTIQNFEPGMGELYYNRQTPKVYHPKFGIITKQVSGICVSQDVGTV